MSPGHAQSYVEWAGRSLCASVPRPPTVTPVPSCRASRREDDCIQVMNHLGGVLCKTPSQWVMQYNVYNV